MKDIPRIRGRVGQIEAPVEHKDKWAFEISVWTFDGETQIGEPIGPFGMYDTEKEAVTEMRKACRASCEAIEKKETGRISGKFMDMKNGGILRSWDEN